MDVMREYWKELIENARAGNVKYARAVLTDFIETVKEIAGFQHPENFVQ